MTAITDQCDITRQWLDREDYDNVLVTSWIRQGEQLLNQSLMIKDMIQIDTATIITGRVLLPEDWIKLDFVRKQDGKPLHFIPRDTFYESTPKETERHYTISGNYIILGGTPDPVDGLKVELHYYGNVPTLGENPSWLSTLYPTLQLFSTLSFAFVYGVEDDRAAATAGLLDSTIKTLNEQHLMSKASGSFLSRNRPKGYG